jgi:hypothetical protein
MEYRGIEQAILMAEERVKEIKTVNPTFLRNYDLEVIKEFKQCKPDEILKTVINYYSQRKKLIGILGPCKFFMKIVENVNF